MPARVRVRPFAALSAVAALLVASATLADVATAAGGRVRRQLPPIEQGNQVVDDIFQIPISTLNAVGSLIKSTRPLVRRTRERIQQYYAGQLSQQQQQRPTAAAFSPRPQQQYSSYGIRPYPAAQYGSASQQQQQQQYGVRPFFSGFSFGGSGGNRNGWQQRDDPLPQGRQHRHRPDPDDY